MKDLTKWYLSIVDLLGHLKNSSRPWNSSVKRSGHLRNGTATRDTVRLSTVVHFHRQLLQLVFQVFVPRITQLVVVHSHAERCQSDLVNDSILPVDVLLSVNDFSAQFAVQFSNDRQNVLDGASGEQPTVNTSISHRTDDRSRDSPLHGGADRAEKPVVIPDVSEPDCPWTLGCVLDRWSPPVSEIVYALRARHFVNLCACVTGSVRMRVRAR